MKISFQFIMHLKLCLFHYDEIKKIKSLACNFMLQYQGALELHTGLSYYQML
jgi:hypothetical protein